MNFFSSRLPAFRFIAIAASIQLGLTYVSNTSTMPTLRIQEYMQGDIKSNAPFIITGVLKPRSIKIEKGLKKKFKITDNLYDIICDYQGITQFEFSEGDMLILQSYCPNVHKRQNIVVKNYLTKHSMESNQWQKKKNIDKKNFGLEIYT